MSSRRDPLGTPGQARSAVPDPRIRSPRRPVVPSRRDEGVRGTAGHAARGPRVRRRGLGRRQPSRRGDPALRRHRLAAGPRGWATSRSSSPRASSSESSSRCSCCSAGSSPPGPSPRRRGRTGHDRQPHGGRRTDARPDRHHPPDGVAPCPVSAAAAVRAAATSTHELRLPRAGRDDLQLRPDRSTFDIGSLTFAHHQADGHALARGRRRGRLLRAGLPQGRRSSRAASRTSASTATSSCATASPATRSASRATTFVPLLFSFFFFIWVLNFMSIVPVRPVPGDVALRDPARVRRAGLPAVGAARRQAPGRRLVLQGMTMPPDVPKAMYVLLIPIEILSNFIVRPFTHSVRLFANMFAGHMLIVTFSVATWYLLVAARSSASSARRPRSPSPWASPASRC